MHVCFKSKLLDPKKEKSPTHSNFEIFEHESQLDIKLTYDKLILKRFL